MTVTVVAVAEPPPGLHADGCDGRCSAWLGTGTRTCLGQPCSCTRSQREGGKAVCWYRRRGYEEAPDGGYKSKCDCWGGPRTDKPENCCSWHERNPYYGPRYDPNAPRFIPKLPPPPVIIILTDDDIDMIEKDTAARGLMARAMGLARDRNVNRGEAKYQRQELIGSYGEAAVHRYLGLLYTGTNGSFRERRDAGPWGVRATDWRKGCLIYRPADGEPPDEPTIFAVVDPPSREVRLVGWLWGYEVTGFERMHSPGVTEYYQAPQDALRPVVFDPGASPRLTGIDPHLNRRVPQTAPEEGEGERLDYLGPAVIPEIDVSLWLELPSDPEAEHSVYERLWTREESTCPCPTPFDGQKPPRGWHCASCHHHFANYSVGEQHRRRWTEPCRDPADIRDVDTGASLMRQAIDGVWSLAYPTT